MQQAVSLGSKGSKAPAAAYARAGWLVVVVAARLFAHALLHPCRPARLCRLTGRVTP